MFGFLRKKREEIENFESNNKDDDDIDEDLFDYASICFTINSEGNVDIDVSWEPSKEMAPLLGQLLFNINSGNMTPIIVQLLAQRMVEDPESRQFIQTVTQTWHSNIPNNMPLVRPMKTFGASRIQ
jgi:hypothetical protein